MQQTFLVVNKDIFWLLAEKRPCIEQGCPCLAGAARPGSSVTIKLDTISAVYYSFWGVLGDVKKS